jgi:hypothetical protein
MGLFKNLMENRTERVTARQDSKTERQSLRSSAKEAAYAAGINPTQAFSDAVKGASDITKSFFTPGAASLGAGAAADGSKTPPPTAATSTPMWIWLLGGVVVLWFLMKRKK